MRTFVVAAAVAIGVSVMAQSDPAAEVLAFEREVEAAIVRGDVEFMERACAPTFVFSHGDGWTTGGDPFRVDTRAQWMAVVKSAPYASRELDRVRVEMHGDIAITYGRYVARMKGGDPERQQFDLWFERVYARRDGRWQYLSHRTVDGPHFSRIK
ncbi:MAG TPA: nuclear transport factor 2 family protein [Vicinamibacterales bacterium]|nr:nuclear transport factor 2 family protein [Vicinamibacterales bacterium]